MKKGLVILIVLFILGFGVARGYQHLAAREGNVGKPEQASAIARIDKIEMKVSASGVVEPSKREILKAGDGYTVDKILVKANSVVKGGGSLISFKKRGNTLNAPYDGVITKVMVKEEDKVSIGQPLLEIFSNRHFETKIMVDELDIPSITIGQEVQIVVKAFPQRVFAGKVTDISQEGKTANGISSFPVTVKFEEIDGVRAGMTTEATIVTAIKEEALVIPIEAVSIVAGEKTVLVENPNGTTETRIVETGISSNIMVEIISGLEEMEKVQLPQTTNDLFQLIPGGFPVQGEEKDSIQTEGDEEDEGVL